MWLAVGCVCFLVVVNSVVLFCSFMCVYLLIVIFIYVVLVVTFLIAGICFICFRLCLQFGCLLLFVDGLLMFAFGFGCCLALLELVSLVVYVGCLIICLCLLGFCCLRFGIY